MRTDRRWLVMVVGAALVATAGCATSEEWQTWKSHPAHFASGQHMAFSLRNGGGAAKVTRQDIALARDEGWWGRPITVGQEQIIER